MPTRIEEIGIFADDVRYLSRGSGGSRHKMIYGDRQLVFESNSRNPVVTLKIIRKVSAHTRRAVEYCLYTGKGRAYLQKRTRPITHKGNHSGPIRRVPDSELGKLNALFLSILDPEGTRMSAIGTRNSSAPAEIPDLTEYKK